MNFCWFGVYDFGAGFAFSRFHRAEMLFDLLDDIVVMNITEDGDDGIACCEVLFVVFYERFTGECVERFFRPGATKPISGIAEEGSAHFSKRYG